MHGNIHESLTIGVEARKQRLIHQALVKAQLKNLGDPSSPTVRVRFIDSCIRQEKEELVEQGLREN